MEARDRSIVTQVAFKEASAWAIANGVNLTTDEGKVTFETVFSHLLDSLLIAVEAVNQSHQEQAERVKGQFPGSEFIPQQQKPGPYDDGGQQPRLTVKGDQHGPLPAWLFEQAAKKGVTEVYDNRPDAAGTNKPHFKSTSGGYDAPAFWPPKTYNR